MAEALAQAALHDSYLLPFLLGAEEAAAKTRSQSSTKLPDLYEAIRNDEKLGTSARWSDPNKLRDGVLQRAPDEMISYASRWTVDTTKLENKTAEMVSAIGKLSILLDLKMVLTSKSSTPRQRNAQINRSSSTSI